MEISTWVGCQEFRLGVKLVAIRRAGNKRYPLRLEASVRIVVQDPGLAALVREAVGVRTEVVLDAGGKREGWKKAIRRRVTKWIDCWHQNLLMGGGTYLCEGRNDPSDVKRFLAAAGTCLSAEPWAGIEPHMAFEMTVLGHEYLVCVIGGGKGTPGIMVLDRPADYAGLGGTGTTGLPRQDFEAEGKMVFWHFVQEGSIDPRIVAECNDLGWNRGTFPRPFILAGGNSYMPDSADLFVMSCACHALAGLTRSRPGRIRDDVKQKRRCSFTIGSGRRISVGLHYPHSAIEFEHPTYDRVDPETDAAVQDAIRFIRDAGRRHGLSEDPDPIES